MTTPPKHTRKSSLKFSPPKTTATREYHEEDQHKLGDESPHISSASDFEDESPPSTGKTPPKSALNKIKEMWNTPAQAAADLGEAITKYLPLSPFFSSPPSHGKGRGGEAKKERRGEETPVKVKSTDVFTGERGGEGKGDKEEDKDKERIVETKPSSELLAIEFPDFLVVSNGDRRAREEGLSDEERAATIKEVQEARRVAKMNDEKERRKWEKRYE